MADNAYRFSQSRFGNPRNESPAFQREWKYLNSSSVLIDNIGTGTQEVVKAVSSTGVSGTLYVWGFSMATVSNAAQAGIIKDDEGNEILTLCATRNGPYFLQLSTPIEITANSALTFRGLASDAAAYVTPLYATSYLKYEGTI